VLGTNVTGVTWLNTAGCKAPALASDEKMASAPPRAGAVSLCNQSGTGDRSRNCLVTSNRGWHVSFAQTQSTGEPVQRVADTMVDRIFSSFRSARSILTTRARLRSLTLENAPARPPRGGAGLPVRIGVTRGWRRPPPNQLRPKRLRGRRPKDWSQPQRRRDA
jgi:hypothetical protein